MGEDANLSARVKSILQQAVSSGSTRLLCLDFDATILQVHTYGAWRGTAEQLSAHVRPVFVHLLREAMSFSSGAEDLFVSVVTFSTQSKLIRKVLSIVLQSEELAKRVMIRCNDLQWEWPRGFEEAGKQGHIGSVLEEIRREKGDRIPLSQVVLIDDDVRNIEVAKRSGMRTTVFPVIPLPERGGPTREECAAEGKRLTELFLDQLQEATSKQQ